MSGGIQTFTIGRVGPKQHPLLVHPFVRAIVSPAVAMIGMLIAAIASTSCFQGSQRRATEAMANSLAERYTRCGDSYFARPAIFGSLMEVRNARFEVSEVPLTSADRLNGVTWRAAGVARSEEIRTHNGKRWSEWRSQSWDVPGGHIAEFDIRETGGELLVEATFPFGLSKPPLCSDIPGNSGPRADQDGSASRVVTDTQPSPPATTTAPVTSEGAVRARLEDAAAKARATCTHLNDYFEASVAMEYPPTGLRTSITLPYRYEFVNQRTDEVLFRSEDSFWCYPDATRTSGTHYYRHDGFTREEAERASRVRAMHQAGELAYRVTVGPHTHTARCADQ